MKKTKLEYYLEVKIIAENKNITLLSQFYTKNYGKLLFRCKKCGKEWEDCRANIVKRKLGFRCPKCSGGINRHYTLDDMNDIAAQKPGGGKCLSRIFRGTKKYHLWKCGLCSKIWFAKPRDIIGKASRPQGTWCPRCSHGMNERICRKFFEEIFNKKFPKESRLKWLRDKKMHLDGYNRELKLAFEYNGKQHYKRIPLYHPNPKDFIDYLKRDEYKRKMCNQNGINLIEVGYVKKNGNLFKIKFGEMEDYIRDQCEEKGIKVPNKTKKIDWKQFDIAPKEYLEEIKQIARNKGGKCLSQQWLGAHEKLEFECRAGHHFRAYPTQMKGTPSRPKGSWCRICNFKNLPQNQLKYSKNDLDQLAILRGGLRSECLSSKYLGFHKKHIWKCSKGHIFSARFDSVKGYSSRPQGTWCRKCAIEHRNK